MSKPSDLREYAEHIAQRIAEGLWGFEDVLPIVTEALQAQREASEEKAYRAWVNSTMDHWEPVKNAIFSAVPQDDLPERVQIAQECIDELAQPTEEPFFGSVAETAFSEPTEEEVPTARFNRALSEDEIGVVGDILKGHHEAPNNDGWHHVTLPIGAPVGTIAYCSCPECEARARLSGEEA